MDNIIIKNSMPSISILMAVKNGLPYLDEAIKSVLNQTHADFQLVVVDDASTDGTVEYIGSLSDDRILLVSAIGAGLVDALNTGLEYCTAPLVARMDADDVCMENRLALQFKAMSQCPDIGVLFSGYQVIDEASSAVKVIRPKFKDQNQIRESLLIQGGHINLLHPSVMIRTDILRSVGGYRRYLHAEDRDLWIRLVDVVKFEILDDTLLNYRLNSTGVSAKNRAFQSKSAVLAVVNYEIIRRFGVDLYVEDRTTWRAFDEYMTNIIFDHAGSMEAFEEFKKLVREVHIGKALLVVVSNLFDDPKWFFPRSRAKQFRVLVGDIVNLYVLLKRHATFSK